MQAGPDYRKDHDMMLLQIRASYPESTQLIAFVIWHYVLDLMFSFFNEGYGFFY